jgi:hypothetical protein
MRALAGAAVVAAAVLAAPGTAGASPGQAMVRVAHFSPDAQYVDVYVVTLDRTQMFPNVFYKNVSSYWKVNAGPFTYEVRPAGAAATSKPAVRLTGNLRSGGAYTVAALGRKAHLGAVLLADDLSPTGRDSSKVRFLDAAVDLPPLDVAVAGKVVASRVAFSTSTGYRQLPAGTVRLEARKAGRTEVLIRDDLRLQAGTVNSVALVGGAGQPREAFRFADATGVRAMPSGALRTGAGGTAPGPPGAPGSAPEVGTALAAFGGVALAGMVTARRRRRALAALALLLGGCAQPTTAGAGALDPAPAPAPRVPAGTGPGVHARTQRPEVAPLPRQPTVPGAASPPVRVVIPAVAVDAPLVRLGLAADGSMEVPADFSRAGWFQDGALPGQPGPAVIAGHVDSTTGPAVFYRLRKLRPGDTIRVDRADGVRLRFVVEERAQYPKASFPTAAVFGPVPWAALRLVTCGGTFDRGRRSYRDDVVVYARLAGSSPG